MNLALYRVLVKLGASEDEAAGAAGFDPSPDFKSAFKSDLKADIAKLEANLKQTILIAMIGLTVNCIIITILSNL